MTHDDDGRGGLVPMPGPTVIVTSLDCLPPS